MVRISNRITEHVLTIQDPCAQNKFEKDTRRALMQYLTQIVVTSNEVVLLREYTEAVAQHPVSNCALFVAFERLADTEMFDCFGRVSEDICSTAISSYHG